MYVCRFDGQCVINKNKRNQCKCCRLEKCCKAGMRKEAVQSERDTISTKNKVTVKNDNDTSDHDGLSVTSLHKVDLKFRMSKSPVTVDYLENIPSATITDLCDAMKLQLVNLVEWAKHINAFNELLLEDQVALLRAHAGEHLVLGVSRRSLNLNGVLLLSTNAILSKQIPRKYSSTLILVSPLCL